MIELVLSKGGILCLYSELEIERKREKVIKSFYYDISSGDETVTEYDAFFYSIKPIWIDRGDCVFITFYISDKGLYSDYPIWIETEEKYKELIWDKIKSEFSGGLIDEENLMVGIEWPYKDDASESDIKKAAIDLVEKIKKVLEK